jgi:hypothetical protein
MYLYAEFSFLGGRSERLDQVLVKARQLKLFVVSDLAFKVGKRSGEI